MKIILKKSYAGDIIYYIALFIYILYSSLTNSMLGQSEGFTGLYPIISFLVVFLCLVKMSFQNKFNIKFLIAVSILFGIICIVWVKGETVLPVVLAVLTSTAYGCSSKIIAKIFLITDSFVLIISALAAKIGIVEDRIFYREYSIIPRHSMGMTYTTIWAGMVFFVLCAYFYLKKDRIKPSDYIVVFLISFYSYYVSGGRMEFYASLLLLILIFLYKYLKENKLFLFVSRNSLIIFFVLTCAIQYIYSTDPIKYRWLDDLMSHRLRCTLEVLNEYNITLFGQFVKMQGWGTINFDNSLGYFFIDSFYLNYMLQYGIVVMMFFIIVYTAVMHRLSDKQNPEKSDPWIMIFLFIAALHGAIISSIVVPYICPFFIIGVATLSEKKNGNVIVEKDHGESIFVGRKKVKLTLR